MYAAKIQYRLSQYEWSSYVTKSGGQSYQAHTPVRAMSLRGVVTCDSTDLYKADGGRFLPKQVKED